jgi:hypothetical protein
MTKSWLLISMVHRKIKREPMICRDSKSVILSLLRLKGAEFRHCTTVLFSLWPRQELILRSHLGVIHKMHD